MMLIIEYVNTLKQNKNLINTNTSLITKEKVIKYLKIIFIFILIKKLLIAIMSTFY